MQYETKVTLAALALLVVVGLIINLAVIPFLGKLIGLL